MTGRSPGTILCVNHWHDDNPGDSAITEATIRLLRVRWPMALIRVATFDERGGEYLRHSTRHLRKTFPDVVFETCLAPTELGTMAKSFPTQSIRSSWVRRCVWVFRMLSLIVGMFAHHVPARTKRRLKGVDLMVVLGGSDVYDDAEMQAVFSLFRLTTVLNPLWAAQRMGIPTVMLGHTLGPFPRRLTKRLAMNVLRRVDRLIVREANSFAFAQSLGLSPELAPDLAFGVEPRRTQRVSDILKKLPEEGARCLGLVVRTHPHAQPELDRKVSEQLAGLASSFLNDQSVTHVLVICHAHGPSAVEDDLPVSSALLSMLPTGSATLVCEDLSAAELASLYGACQFVVAVRLHGAILAMVGGTVAFAIAYLTKKTEGVMRLIGAPDAWLEYDKVTARTIAERLPQISDSASRLRLKSTVELFQSQLNGIFSEWSPTTAVSVKGNQREGVRILARGEKE